jgi:hypothetical protein
MYFFRSDGGATHVAFILGMEIGCRYVNAKLRRLAASQPRGQLRDGDTWEFLRVIGSVLLQSKHAPEKRTLHDVGIEEGTTLLVSVVKKVTFGHCHPLKRDVVHIEATTNQPRLFFSWAIHRGYCNQHETKHECMRLEPITPLESKLLRLFKRTWLRTQKMDCAACWRSAQPSCELLKRASLPASY